MSTIHLSAHCWHSPNLHNSLDSGINSTEKFHHLASISSWGTTEVNSELKQLKVILFSKKVTERVDCISVKI